ncbi:hypothetical protein [Helicobacter cynogastricus]|uniref:hypothetical protein n=1 Tax=Helicobacter cynogastricus TaxID=329937 RepID=UPI000CF02A1F|nr:hypothetical protein [Helicobacter cynogastricus]
MHSKKATPYKVFAASIFFILVVCNSLALLFSSFSHNFSQLSNILNAHFYPSWLHFIYLCGLLGSLFYFLRATRYNVFLPKVGALGVSVFCTYCLFFPPSLRFEVFYVFPLASLAGLHIGYKKIPILFTFAPSISTCILWVYACGLQSALPHWQFSTLFDFSLFLVVLAGLVSLVSRHKEYLGVYEYANLLVLCAGLVVCLLCPKALEGQENARAFFFWLGMLSWVGEWMHESLRLKT